MTNTPNTAIKAADVEPEAIEWLWPLEANLPEDDENHRAGKIPAGMLTTIDGRPGEGKSTLTAFLATEVSNRKAPYRNGVIFSNMEDPIAQVLRPRLEAAGANLQNVHFFNFFLGKRDEEIERTVEMLRSMIRALNVALIIADPIAAHLGVSLYNDQEVRRVLSPLTKMLAEEGVSLIAIAHANKHVSVKGDNDALEAVGGSGGGLVGASRAVYAFGRDPEDESIRVLAQQKCNIAARSAGVAFDMEDSEWVVGSGDKATVIRSGKLVFLSDEHKATPRAILAGKKGEGEGVPAEKKAIAAEWLTSYLVGYYGQAGEWPAAKVVRDDAADQGISFATLKRASAEVGVVKGRKGFGPGSYIEWILPDSHPAMQQLALPAMVAGDEAATEDGPEPEPIDFDTLAGLEQALAETPDLEEDGDA